MKKYERRGEEGKRSREEEGGRERRKAGGVRCVLRVLLTQKENTTRGHPLRVTRTEHK